MTELDVWGVDRGNTVDRGHLWSIGSEDECSGQSLKAADAVGPSPPSSCRTVRPWLTVKACWTGSAAAGGGGEGW